MDPLGIGFLLIFFYCTFITLAFLYISSLVSLKRMFKTSLGDTLLFGTLSKLISAAALVFVLPIGELILLTVLYPNYFIGFFLATFAWLSTACANAFSDYLFFAKKKVESPAEYGTRLLNLNLILVFLGMGVFYLALMSVDLWK